MDCIFCKIAKGELPSLKVYEDENALVFMDIAKDADGHMVAIPKKHVKNILDCDAETLRHLMDAVKKVADHCVDSRGYVYRERRMGSYSRSFDISGIEEAAITAKYENGVLTLDLPKAQKPEKRCRNIELS